MNRKKQILDDAKLRASNTGKSKIEAGKDFVNNERDASISSGRMMSFLRTFVSGYDFASKQTASLEGRSRELVYGIEKVSEQNMVSVIGEDWLKDLINKYK